MASIGLLLEVVFLDRRSSTALLVSLKHISLKPAGRLIALALRAKDQFLPVGLWSRTNRN